VEIYKIDTNNAVQFSQKVYCQSAGSAPDFYQPYADRCMSEKRFFSKTAVVWRAVGYSKQLSFVDNNCSLARSRDCLCYRPTQLSLAIPRRVVLRGVETVLVTGQLNSACPFLGGLSCEKSRLS